MSAERDFSKDFIWGTATASYQVEGAAHEDGKGPSIWNAFEKTPGGIVDNVNGDITSNQYHCYPEDIRLMKNAGMNAYRFSIAWSRIFPEGKGKVNPKGLDYYKRLCDGLLENGITPYVTLYHWDLPLALQEQYGGWESRETAKYFADYAAVAVDGLGDRVKHYFTVNEFLGCTDNGYSVGIIAPGLRLDNKRVCVVCNFRVSERYREDQRKLR
jgi:beta-glucosidase